MIRVFDQGKGMLLVYDTETGRILAKNATQNQAIGAWACKTAERTDLAFEEVRADGVECITAVNNPEKIVALAEAMQENGQFKRIMRLAES